MSAPGDQQDGARHHRKEASPGQAGGRQGGEARSPVPPKQLAARGGEALAAGRDGLGGGWWDRPSER
eukprot:828038-Pyramimonas_sp.AAC.1